MRFALPAIVLAALATPAIAGQTQATEKKGETDAQEQEEAKDQKTCRYIRLDMSSRRKEKVCLTKEGWQKFNQGN